MLEDRSESNPTTLFQIMNKGLDFFSRDEFFPEFVEARGQFFLHGQLPDESRLDFSPKYQQFLDWYFFSRPLNRTRLAPFLCLEMFPQLEWTKEERELIPHFRTVVHSFFQVYKVKRGTLTVTDIRSRERYLIESVDSDFFIAGQIFDGRVLRYQKKFLLMHGRCFHPPDANEFILKEVKTNRKDLDWDFEKFSLLLHKMRHLYDRYPHASIGQIYSLNNRWFKDGQAS